LLIAPRAKQKADSTNSGVNNRKPQTTSASSLRPHGTNESSRNEYSIGTDERLRDRENQASPTFPSPNPIRGEALASPVSFSTAPSFNSIPERQSLSGPLEGVGEDTDESAPTVVFARARYAYNPTPEYPERARREGWEGIVILRVLVDREGKSRRVEVGQSSGFEVLDRAAVEGVKSWRFYPARYGDRLVETWVKVPIVFRLANDDGQTSIVNR